MDTADVKRIIREERDKERTISIEISKLSGPDYIKLRDKLKRRAPKLVSGVPCVLFIKDDEGTVIRKKDGW